jgi:Mlc titration factor MtfA (ptsG expression regulator)
MIGIAILVALLTGVFWVVKKKQPKSNLSVPNTFPLKWRAFLNAEVSFYRNLNEEDKAQFEKDILSFLKRIRITGIKTNVSDEDRLLVAASGIIPVFRFENWNYQHLHEVLLYPNAFDEEYNIGTEQARITGMVGSGAMANLIIFSKPALHQGFKNSRDKKNVGIHEFVHLFDKEDGVIDGLPEIVLNNQTSMPWLKLIQEKTDEIFEGESDINSYGATNSQEFLAVASEYFFERPKLLKKKHPKLYEAMQNFFDTDLAEVEQKEKPTGVIRRNDPCPCGSGKKFKQCCLK